MRELVVRTFVGCVVGLGAAANGQSFAEYFIVGVNLTDPDRGTDNVIPGDVLRMSVRVNHDGLSFAGGRVDVLFQGVDPSDIAISEDAFGFPFDPWEIGRTPILRIDGSDGPPDAVQPRNRDIVATVSHISDEIGDWIDLTSEPPGLGGLAGAFPTASGDEIFVFDYVYRGGADCWDVESDATATLWASHQDVKPDVVSASVGDTLGCVGSSCGADLDGDFDVDVDDFFAYLDGFASGDLSVCDVDLDGDCDADDFFVFLDLFAKGC